MHLGLNFRRNSFGEVLKLGRLCKLSNITGQNRKPLFNRHIALVRVIVLSTLQVLTHSILITIPLGQHYDHPNFTSEAQKVNCPRSTAGTPRN